MSLTGPIISIEDDEDDQFFIAKALKALNVPNPVRFFWSGEAALEYLNTTTETPFLILCDVNMPLLNGIELRQRIIANAYLRQKSIPFIFLTTSDGPELINAAYDAMVQGYYRKAAHFERLREQLRSIVVYWQNCLHPNNEP